MIRDNLFTLTINMAPPEDNDEAMQRVSEFGGDCLTNLVGTVYHDYDQLRRALDQCGWNAADQPRLVLDSGRIRTLRAEVSGRAGTAVDGFRYVMIVSEVGGHWARVDNCKLVQVGKGADAEAAEQVKEAIKGPSDE